VQRSAESKARRPIPLSGAFPVMSTRAPCRPDPSSGCRRQCLYIWIDGAHPRFAAVIMGKAGIQHGLLLYPDGIVPAGLEDWEPSPPVPTPAGTVASMLDLPSEVPADVRGKAFRYEWSLDAELAPVAIGPRLLSISIHSYSAFTATLSYST
jgi:hypothetical protein